MPSFSELPSELVEHILSYLAQPSLYAVSQVSWSLYAISIPFLYRHADLLISPGEKVPRIDRLFFSILADEKRAKHVRSLRVGLSPKEGVRDGPRFLPRETESQDHINYRKAMELLELEPVVRNGEDLREAVWSRDYGAYAALLLLALPSLHRLEIADYECSTLRPLHVVLRQLKGQTSTLAAQTSVHEISYNFDGDSGLQYSNHLSDVILWQALNLTGVQRVEFFLPAGRYNSVFESVRFSPLPKTLSPTHITSLTIRHSSAISRCLRGLLEGAPQLRLLACELWYDFTKHSDREVVFNLWIALGQWTDELRIVKDTLRTLVLSVEFCDSEKSFFRQPDVRPQFSGYLDLRDFSRLHTLEVPIPFISGDPNFSITLDFEPLFPPNLRNLTLRTDMSRAQFPYPFDASILPEGPSYEDAREETTYLMGARMDVSYMFQTTLALVDRHTHLDSVTVWQPPDPSLYWFEYQLEDFAITSRNRSVAAKVIYPLMLPWKAAEHWNLVKEKTLFDPSCQIETRFDQLFRGERAGGIPLGLATQYHLNEFQRRHVRKFK